MRPSKVPQCYILRFDIQGFIIFEISLERFSVCSYRLLACTTFFDEVLLKNASRDLVKFLYVSIFFILFVLIKKIHYLGYWHCCLCVHSQ